MKKLNLYLLILVIFNTTLSSGKEYHVSIKGNDTGDGSASKPFKTISTAVKYAFPGDTVTVHAGTYREWINPIRTGESDSKRIIYRAAPGEKVEIKGSEIITGWQKEKDGVWKVIIPNSLFGDYNPFQAGRYDGIRLSRTGSLTNREEEADRFFAACQNGSKCFVSAVGFPDGAHGYDDFIVSAVCRIGVEVAMETVLGHRP